MIRNPFTLIGGSNLLILQRLELVFKMVLNALRKNQEILSAQANQV